MLIDALKPDCIHIWKISIADKMAQLAQLQQLLCEDELVRAHRYVTQTLTNNYICTRGVLRQLLSDYLNTPGDGIRFSEGDHGKPFLFAEHDVPLHFNVSHSKDCAVYAFCRDFEVGVDVENMQRIKDQLPIAERFFTQAECQELRDLESDAQTERFFYFWTRKEALLKATGKGLTQSLDSIDARQEQIIDQGQQWLLHTLEIDKPYCLSVAVVPEITDIQIMSSSRT